VTTKQYRRLTPEKLAEIAKQFKTRREFYDGDPSAFVSAGRKKIEVPDPKDANKLVEISLLDHICAHMYKKRFRWTKAMIAGVAKQYDTRSAFASGNKAAYSAALRQDVLDDVCAHMSKDKRGTLWTVERLTKLATDYDTREDFRQKQPKAFNAAKRRDMLDTLFPEPQDA